LNSKYKKNTKEIQKKYKRNTKEKKRFLFNTSKFIDNKKIIIIKNAVNSVTSKKPVNTSKL